MINFPSTNNARFIVLSVPYRHENYQVEEYVTISLPQVVFQ